MRLLVEKEGKVKDKFKVKEKGNGQVQGQGRLVFSKSPRKSRVRPSVCSETICLVTFGAKVTKTWGWDVR